MAEGYEGKRVVFVNMGELDRFNKEGGGHAAGDAALHDAAVQIEKIVKGAVDGSASAEGYEIFRYSGTEFADTGLEKLEDFDADTVWYGTVQRAGVRTANGSREALR
ncbi:hypothetical protein ACFLZO_00290 [Patescibacteria group bacterium]